MKFSALLFPTILIIAACSNTNKKIMSGIKSTSNPVIAHRGAWKAKQLPENSIASLKAAIELGCYGSEFDVRMTADDSLVINHDPAHAGMEIEKVNYSELVKHPLSNGEKIPTLAEYIQAGTNGNHKTTLIVEIKPSGISKERGQAIAVKVVNLIKQLDAPKMVEYISFDYDILKKIHELDAAAITQYLEGDKAPDELKKDGISGADYHFSVYDKHPEWITQAINQQLILNAWTVNSSDKMEQLLKSGVHFITTNEPELAFAIYQQLHQQK